MSLLSLSPLLSSLFITYATRASSTRSASTSPSPESDEWKSLQDTIATLREENEKLRSDIQGMNGRLEAAEASQEEFRSLGSSLREINATREEEIKSLRVQVFEAQHKYNRLVEDSNAEATALKVQVEELQVSLGSRLIVGLNVVIDTRVSWAETTGAVEGDRC